MSAHSASLWQQAAELSDQEYEDSWAERPRCPHCGCFLTVKPEDQGFDTMRDEYFESRTCLRCQRVVNEAVW